MTDGQRMELEQPDTPPKRPIKRRSRTPLVSSCAWVWNRSQEAMPILPRCMRDGESFVDEMVMVGLLETLNDETRR